MIQYKSSLSNLSFVIFCHNLQKIVPLSLKFSLSASGLSILVVVERRLNVGERR